MRNMNALKNKIPSKLYDAIIKAKIEFLSTIVNTPKLLLAEKIQLDLQDTQTIIIEASKLILPDGIKLASEISDCSCIATGCIDIDSILNGGIPVNGIVEIIGCSGVGKTQLCLQLSLRTQLSPSLGGLSKSVVYICTEDAFPAKRLNEIAKIYSERHDVDFEDNIFLNHIADWDQLCQCLFKELPKLCAVREIGLVIIDSIAGVFRSENQEADYLTRSQDLVSIATKLHQLSSLHGFAIVCVNQVTDNLQTETTEPCLGLTWSNLITSRYKITRIGDNPERKFEVIFSPNLPPKSCLFQITERGLMGIQQ